MTNVATMKYTITEQYLDVMIRFISEHKTWNHSEQFAMLIAPKKDESVQPKKESFDIFSYTARYASQYLEELWSFLNRFLEF